MKQTNNEYLALPQSMWDVYQDAEGRSLFHSPSGNPLSSEEEDTLTSAWQENQVQSGNASWDNDPCERCREAVCICGANVTGGFCLPPED